MAELAGVAAIGVPLRPYDPRQIGPYRLLRRLGSGGQADVFLGVEHNGRYVAVRTIRETLDDPRIRERFVRELELARRVQAFCTAPIVAHEVDNDPPFVVSEFIPGPTLYRYVVENGPMSGDNLEQLAVGTATALTAIHRVGVVHCDFKPDNVILGPLGPRVIDFGIAQALDGTLTVTIRGAPPYLAPERFRGEPARQPCDIFAWAATIAFAASGSPPFGREDKYEIRQRVLTEPPKLTGLSPAVEGLIRECLAKDERDRPTADQVLFRLLGHADQAAPTVRLETVLKEGSDEARQLRPTPPATSHQPTAVAVPWAPTPPVPTIVEPTPPAVPADTWPERLRKEYVDPWGISAAIFLGALGGSAGYLASAAAGTAAAIGAATFAVVYLVRLVLAVALPPQT
jgi:serine/threonine protein kinase